MAVSCQEQAERVEETVLQPVDHWVDGQEQRCRDEPCNWWTLCLNKLFCWIVVVLVKVSLWITTIVVRWVYRTVCAVVTVVVGVVALLFGNSDILFQALKDLWTLAKDGFYSAIGAVIFVALRIVDLVQTVLRIQPAKRRLTEDERKLLWPIFRDSLAYDVIELVVGPAGVLGISGRPFTMGFTIYLPMYSDPKLVHECVHTWQFQFSGFRYVGNSALHQLDSIVFSPSYNPYSWQPRMGAGDSWFALPSVEAQAKFIEDVYTGGIFHSSGLEATDDISPGAFFREDDSGVNSFVVGGVPYTQQANDAWRILRTR
ncbi:hypothetical protein [Streptomyces ureilyticus]|uniref:DUF4157 domain-containing protein n=1 Tax=Streptomyces ureilyticus TaxID=1775131 RepID=A0ABX0E637_9ACTN|nr:hypothetical protein [Streptomyces ureilyticus]NGO49173.1 hypothetical protein [Streptomyces ureilyticus]